MWKKSEKKWEKKHKSRKSLIIKGFRRGARPKSLTINELWTWRGTCPECLARFH